MQAASYAADALEKNGFEVVSACFDRWLRRSSARGVTGWRGSGTPARRWRGSSTSSGGSILNSLKKTNRVLFLDEDVPGGTSAFMLREVLEVQGGYGWLDATPRTLSGNDHRPAYGSDGDYWSKPNRETIFETVYEMMHEGNPRRFPIFYK